MPVLGVPTCRRTRFVTPFPPSSRRFCLRRAAAGPPAPALRHRRGRDAGPVPRQQRVRIAVHSVASAQQGPAHAFGTPPQPLPVLGGYDEWRAGHRGQSRPQVLAQQGRPLLRDDQQPEDGRPPGAPGRWRRPRARGTSAAGDGCRPGPAGRTGRARSGPGPARRGRPRSGRPPPGRPGAARGRAARSSRASRATAEICRMAADVNAETDESV